MLLARPVLRCCFLASYVLLPELGSANVPVEESPFYILFEIYERILIILLMISRHINAVFIVLCNIFKNTSIIRLGDLTISVLEECSGFTKHCRTVNTAADTCHTFNKVFRKLADFQKHQCFLAFQCTAAGLYLQINFFVGFLECFKDGCCYTARYRILLAELTSCCRVSVHSSGSIFFASNMLASSS